MKLAIGESVKFVDFVHQITVQIAALANSTGFRLRLKNGKKEEFFAAFVPYRLFQKNDGIRVVGELMTDTAKYGIFGFFPKNEEHHTTYGFRIACQDPNGNVPCGKCGGIEYELKAPYGQTSCCSW